MVQTMEDNLVHPKTSVKMVNEECIGGKVVGHQGQMATRPVTVEHSMTLDRSLEIENTPRRTLHVFKDHLHHRRLICVVLVGRAVGQLNIVLVYVLQFRIHCLKEEGSTFLAPEIHRTVVEHGEYSSSE